MKREGQKKLEGNACVIETDSLISCFFSLKHKGSIIAISNHKFSGTNGARAHYVAIFNPAKDYTRRFHLLYLLQPEIQRGGTYQQEHLLDSDPH